MASVDGIDWDALTDAEVEHVGDPRFEELSDVTVLGEGGNPEAFIFGEAPGAQEELLRQPFVGPSGRVMRDLMAIAGLFATPSRCGPPHEPNCWLTNTVKFRPPRNRTPTEHEIDAARPWLVKEWYAVGAPIVIIPVGAVALQALTGQKQSILLAAGKLHKYRSRDGVDLCVWPMVHPSFGLRGGESVQALLEADWDKLADWMKQARRHGWLRKSR